MENTHKNKRLSLSDIGPFKWLMDNQKYIAWAFYALLIAGCGYIGTALGEALAKPHFVPVEGDVVRTARAMGISFGD